MLRNRVVPSAVLTISLLAIGMIIDACSPTSTPAAPSNITATPHPGFIRIEWQDNSTDETGFIIYREIVSTTNLTTQALTQLAEVPVDTTSYDDLDVSVGNTYRYALSARGAEGNSARTEQNGGAVEPENGPPRIQSFIVSRYSNAEMIFEWEVSEPEGDDMTCTLDPGDGTAALQIEHCPSDFGHGHVYPDFGSYAAMLAVSDDLGNEATATVEVALTPVPTGLGAPSLAIAGNGTLYLAWRQSQPLDDVFVRRWSGSDWVAVGEPLSANPGATGAWNPSLAIGADNELVIAWSEEDATVATFPEYVHVHSWDGQSWLPLGGALSAVPGSFAGVSRPTLQTGPDGAPVVAWNEWDGQKTQIHVQSWDGSSWQPIGTPQSPADPDTYLRDALSLALDENGFPTVASYAEDGSMPGIDFNIYLWQWNGASWSAEAVLSAYPQGLISTGGPSVATGAGEAVVAWAEAPSDGMSASNLHVYRLDGDVWKPIGSEPRARLGVLVLQLDSSGAPVVAWTGRDEVHVSRWDGSSWSSIGGAVGEGYGDVALVLDASDNPVVAFTMRDSAGLGDLGIWRWDGSDWIRLGGQLRVGP